MYNTRTTHPTIILSNVFCIGFMYISFYFFYRVLSAYEKIRKPDFFDVIFMFRQVEHNVIKPMNEIHDFLNVQVTYQNKHKNILKFCSPLLYNKKTISRTSLIEVKNMILRWSNFGNNNIFKEYYNLASVKTTFTWHIP